MSEDVPDCLEALPFEPEPFAVLRKRLRKAFAKAYSFHDLTQANTHATIATDRKHVLDLPNGFRVVCAVSETVDGVRYRNFLVKRVPDNSFISITEAIATVSLIIRHGILATASVAPNTTHIMLRYGGFKYMKDTPVRKPSDGVHFDPVDGIYSGAV